MVHAAITDLILKYKLVILMLINELIHTTLIVYILPCPCLKQLTPPTKR